MGDIEIRKADLTHLNAVVTLSRMATQWLGWAPRGVYVEAIKHGLVIVAVKDGKHVVGFNEFGGTTKDKWTCYKITVHSAMRGQGIGKALMERLIAEAAEHGAGVRMKIIEGNPMVPAFQHMGFVVVDREASKQTNVLVIEREYGTDNH